MTDSAIFSSEVSIWLPPILTLSLPPHPHPYPIPLTFPSLSATIQEAFQIGIYWAHTNTVHKSTALKLVHDLTSPRWKEGSGSEVVTLDEEGYVEADITLGAVPGRQKVREIGGKVCSWLNSTIRCDSLDSQRRTEGTYSQRPLKVCAVCALFMGVVLYITSKVVGLFTPREAYSYQTTNTVDTWHILFHMP